MNRLPSFGQGVALAVVLSLVGYTAALVGSLTWAINLVAFGYLAYLLYGTSVTTGRVTAAALWLVGTLVALTLDVGHGHLLLWHITTMWLTRSWCYLNTVLQALLDLGLWLVSVAAAVAVIGHTASLGFGLWTLLLIQATWPLLAKFVAGWTNSPTEKNQHPLQTQNGAFDRSRHAAQTALARINNTNS